MSDDIRNLTLVSIALNVIGAVAEYLHPGAGLYPAGAGAGFWLSAGWLWLRSAA